MRNLPGTNRLYENEHPIVYNKIIWYKEKSEWLEDFKRCILITNITPDKILQTLNLDMKEYKEYSEYLYDSILLLQGKRRKRSIEVRKTQKEDKKSELRNLIKLKNTTRKEWSWKYISDLMNITVRHLRRLRNEIDLEDKNKTLLNNVNILKNRLDDYINTKIMIKNIGYENVSKKKFGNIKHIDKILKFYNITDINRLLHILNCNISFILQMSPFYKSGKLDENIISQFDSMKINCSGWKKSIRPTDPKKRKKIINCWKREYKILNDLKEERNILRLIHEYKM